MRDLCGRLAGQLSDPQAATHFRQRLDVAILRGNAISVMGKFTEEFYIPKDTALQVRDVVLCIKCACRYIGRNRSSLLLIAWLAWSSTKNVVDLLEPRCPNILLLLLDFIRRSRNSGGEYLFIFCFFLPVLDLMQANSFSI